MELLIHLSFSTIKYFLNTLALCFIPRRLKALYLRSDKIYKYINDLDQRKNQCRIICGQRKVDKHKIILVKSCTLQEVSCFR
jgi:hypothetical protein